ncbi:MAG TPA: hypothetical protein VNJ46_03665 [Gaiellaceae bacterium]|nr:hypothetical protein [Gaiellaceae bacterium]
MSAVGNWCTTPSSTSTWRIDVAASPAGAVKSIVVFVRCVFES